MSSRSKKILDMVNSKNIPPPEDASVSNSETIIQQCDSPSLLEDSHPESLSKEDDAGQNAAVDVVMLSDITNTPENQRHSNAMNYFKAEQLAHQKYANRKRDRVDYAVSPVNSDVDVSDQDDPTYYERQKKKKKIVPVYPTSSRRSSSRSSSCSSSSSSSGSSSSSTSSSSSSEDSDTTPNLQSITRSEICEVEENKTRKPNTEREVNERNSPNIDEAIEVPARQEISVVEGNETNEPNIEREINEPNNPNIDEEIEVPKKKGRKRTSNPKQWQQNVNKYLRNSGRSYVSTKKETVPARVMKPPCTDKCRLKCSEKITSFQRQSIFDAYWNIGEVNQQRSFIQSCMSDVTPRYKYTNAQRPKECNKAFHFVVDGKTIRVCKSFFVGTLNISDRVIRTVKEKCSKLGVLERDQRGKHNSHHTVDEALISDIKKFIDSIPRLESHYTRQTSSREYIDGAKSIIDLFRDFKEAQEKNNKPSGKYCSFYNVFTKEYNISFFSPKKDQCDVCLQYTNSNDEQKILIRDKFESHLEEKELSRREKVNDRCKIDDFNKVLVFDLQAVLQSPRGNTSAFYYKSKMNSYNFTVTLLNNKVDGQMKHAYTDVHCYFWNETDAKRGANEIGSCLLDCFEKLCSEAEVNGNDGLNLILYSDNCTGQNKNKYLVALYLFAVTHLNIQSITHKYLIKGHTQNEGDNVHSLIEKQIQKNLKSGPIYCPYEYVALIKNAKKSGQKFFVHELTYDFFLDLKKLQEDWGYNFSETTNKNNLTWNEIKVLRVEKSEPFSFYVKTSYKDKEFIKICLRNKRKKMLPLSELTPIKAYTAKQNLSENKRKDIKELIDKNLIPGFYKEFYDTIL